MPSKTAYRGKNEERPRAHGVHLVSESQNEGPIWACASSHPAHKREMPCIGSDTKRMMETARKGSNSNTNCITPRHLRKYVHLRLELTQKRHRLSGIARSPQNRFAPATAQLPPSEKRNRQKPQTRRWQTQSPQWHAAMRHGSFSNASFASQLPRRNPKTLGIHPAF